MVDEFQDTNRLQTELLDLLCEGSDADLFVVGDEFQSIYGFRHADVAVFRERRSAAPTVLPLTRNHRSRPEVLAAVNELFGGEFGDEFQRLEPAEGADAPALRNAFELLVTDKAATAEAGVHWRRSEARHVARRVRELVDAGVASPGEIVVLFAAGTDAEWFEEELRAVGLPTYRAAGRNYFGQQQVADLLSYLRLLHNRYDDEALLGVLASPFVGVSNDTLVLIRAEAQRQPVFRALERPLPADLSEVDRRLLLAFRQRYERLARRSRARAARAPVRAHPRRARLRPRDPRAPRRPAPVRQPPEARAARALLRGAPRRRPRRLRPLCRGSGGGRGEGVGCGVRRGGLGRRPPTHDPRGQGPRVRGRRGRGRGPKPPARLRHPRPLGRALRLQGRASGDGDPGQHHLLPGRQGATRARGAGRAPPSLLRRDDACEGTAHRLGLRRRRRGRERRDADRMGADRLGLRDDARGGAANGPVEVERGAATVLLRVDRGQPDPPPPVVPETVPVVDRRERPAGPVRRLGRGDPGACAPPSRARRRSRSAAPPRCPALLQRHLALRALLVPLLRGAGRRHAAGAVGAVRRERQRARAACHRARRRRPSAARARRPGPPGRSRRPARPRPGLVPGGERERGARDRAACLRVLSTRRSPLVSPGSRVCASSGPSPSRSTTCS